MFLNGPDNLGFSAFPGGIRWYDGLSYFHTGGEFGSWWSSSEYGDFASWLRSIGYDDDRVHRMPSGKDLGYSVRCLRD